MRNLTNSDEGLRYSLAPCESKGISEKRRLLRLFRTSKLRFKIRKAFLRDNRG